MKISYAKSKYALLAVVFLLVVFGIHHKNADSHILDQISQRPVLVLFYREDCAPCHIEMTKLDDIKAAAKNWHVVVVMLSVPDKYLSKKLIDLDVQTIDATKLDTSSVLRSVSDRPFLPLSIIVTDEKHVCARHAGVLDVDTIQYWKSKCSV